MWRGVGVVASAVLALASSFCGVDLASAEMAATGESDAHFLFFGGADLWRYGTSVHGGMLWSPDGLKQEGFTLKLLLAGGNYRYRSGSTEITSYYGLASVLPGWRFKHERLEVVAYAGLDVQDHRATPDDPSNRLRGLNNGVRAGADVWYEPMDNVMFSSSWSASSIGWNFWTRAQFGIRIPEFPWIGPELTALGDPRYQQYRAGVHVTGFRTLDYEWSFGAGYVADSDHRAGPYGRIGLNVRR